MSSNLLQSTGSVDATERKKENPIDHRERRGSLFSMERFQQQITELEQLKGVSDYAKSLKSELKQDIVSLKDLMTLTNLFISCTDALIRHAPTKAESHIVPYLSSVCAFLLYSGDMVLQREKEVGTGLKNLMKVFDQWVSYLSNTITLSQSSSVSEGARGEPFLLFGANRKIEKRYASLYNEPGLQAFDFHYKRGSDIIDCINGRYEIEMLLQVNQQKGTPPVSNTSTSNSIDSINLLNTSWNVLLPAISKIRLTEKDRGRGREDEISVIDKYHYSLRPVYQRCAEECRTYFFSEYSSSIPSNNPSGEASAQAMKRKNLSQFNDVLSTLTSLSAIKCLLKQPYFTSLLSSEISYICGETLLFLDALNTKIKGIVQKVTETSNSSSSTPFLLMEHAGVFDSIQGQVKLIQKNISVCQMKDNASIIDSVDSICSRLLKDAENGRNQCYKKWESYLINGIDDMMGMRRMVMEFDSDGKIKINFSNEILDLIRQASKIQQSRYQWSDKSSVEKLQTASKLLSVASHLQQISAYHNTVHQEINVCHQSLLLPIARQFEKLFSAKRGHRGDREEGEKNDRRVCVQELRWENSEELETFTCQANDAIEILKSMNFSLKKSHQKIIQELRHNLLPKNFFSAQNIEEWKRFVQNNISTIDGISSEMAQFLGTKKLDTVNHAFSWKTHIDIQLCKILSFQFQSFLYNNISNTSSLNSTNLSASSALAGDISSITYDIDISFESGLYSPYDQASLEKRYYSAIQTLSERIQGLPSFSHPQGKALFQKTIHHVLSQNSFLYQKIHIDIQQAIKLPQKLQKFAPYAILAYLSIPDIEGILSGTTPTLEDYQKTLPLLYNMKLELDSLPDIYSFGLFRISILSFKTKFLSGIEKLTTASTALFTRKVAEEISEFEDELREACSLLVDSTPHSLDGLTTIQRAAVEMEKKKNLFKKRILDLERKVQGVKRSPLEIGRQLSVQACKNYFQQLNDKLMEFSSTTKETRQRLQDQLEENAKLYKSQVETFAQKWKDLPINKKETTISPSQLEPLSIELFAHVDEFETLVKKIEQLLLDCISFGIDSPDFPSLDVLTHHVEDTKEAMTLYMLFDTELKDTYGNIIWIAMREQLNSLMAFVEGWQGKIQHLSASHANGPLVPIIAHFRSYIENMHNSYNVYRLCLCPEFKEKHWRELCEILQVPSKNLSQVPSRQIFDISHRLLERFDAIKEVSQRAVGEMVIWESLIAIKKWYNEMEFTFHKVRMMDGRYVNIVNNWNDINFSLSENLTTLSSLKGSRYYAGVRDECEQLETDMAETEKLLSLLQRCQRKWLHLEPVIGQGVVPNENIRFNRLSNEFIRVLKELSESKKLLYQILHISNLSSILSHMSDQLDDSQRALKEFMEEKRNAFSKFYFLGDEDLLDLLGSKQEEGHVKTYVRKLFPAVSDLNFVKEEEGERTSLTIIALISSAGDTFHLQQGVQVTMVPEEWLNHLDQEIKKTLENKLMTVFKARKVASHAQVIDLLSLPSQLCALYVSIMFTEKCEAALNGSNTASLIDELYQTIIISLDSLTKKRQENDRTQEIKIKNMILLLIHQKMILEEIRASLRGNMKITTSAWIWQKQLKFYFDAYQGMVYAQLVSSQQMVTYEYQGDIKRLVQTGLTDKCYLIIMNSLNIKMGSNPYGPAGTGKTETIKALGNQLGRQVLVFNCDDTIDNKSLGNSLIGIVRSGYWGCYDEFNRLQEKVLSCISQYIESIQRAMRENKSFAHFLNKENHLNPYCGIFITLNPASKGYMGRSKLPSNLKMLFRSIAMCQPDTNIITNVLLLSEGFVHSEKLSKKILSIFEITKKLMSVQIHYDWSLRALKSILNQSGRQLLLSLPSMTEENRYEQEEHIVLQSILQEFQCKLTHSDSLLLSDIVKNIFSTSKTTVSSEALLPSRLEDNNDRAEEKESESDVFLQGWRQCIQASNLQYQKIQEEKVQYLFETLKVRNGIIILGDCNSGKSTIWKSVIDTYKHFKKNCHVHIINPKAISKEELLGKLDPNTREWTNGILTNAAKDISEVKEQPDTHGWIIFDGDVDPEWIESLNSVLDDNRILTLANGVRYSFSDSSHFIFETDNLSKASPATISRCGIIQTHCSGDLLNAILSSWLEKATLLVKKEMKAFFDLVYLPTMKYISSSTSYSSITLTNIFLQYLPFNYKKRGSDILLGEEYLEKGVLSNTGKAIVSKEHLCFILYCFLSVIISKEEREGLAEYIFTSAKISLPNKRDSTDIEGVWSVEKSLTEDFVDTSSVNKFLTSTNLAQFQLVPTSAYSAVLDEKRLHTVCCNAFNLRQWRVNDFIQGDTMPLFPSKDTSLYSGVINQLLDCDIPLLVSGTRGHGRNRILRNALQKLQLYSTAGISLSWLNCSQYTQPMELISKIKYATVSTTSAIGKTLRPKDAEKCFFVINDLHLPLPDKYGSVSAVSLLHQIQTYQGFYNPVDTEFVHLNNVNIICTNVPVSIEWEKNNGLSQRLLNRMMPIICQSPSCLEMADIFQQSAPFIAQYLNAQPGTVSHVISCAGSLFQSLNDNLLPLLVSSNSSSSSNASTAIMAPLKIQYNFALKSLEQFLRCFIEGTPQSPVKSTPATPDDILNGLTHALNTQVLSRTNNPQHRDILLDIVEKSFQSHFSSIHGKFSHFSPINPSELSLKHSLVSSSIPVPTNSCSFLYTSLSDRQSEKKTSHTNLSVVSPKEYSQNLAKALHSYNREERQVEWVLHSDLVKQVSLIESTLNSPYSSLTYISPTGSGKLTAATLSAYIKKYQFHRLPLLKASHHVLLEKEYRKKWKEIIEEVCINNSKVLLYVETANLEYSYILEILNTLAARNTFPTNIYTNEEMDVLLQNLKDQNDRSAFNCRERVQESHWNPYYGLLLNRLFTNLKIFISIDSSYEKLNNLLSHAPFILHSSSIVLWNDNVDTENAQTILGIFLHHYMSPLLATLPSSEAIGSGAKLLDEVLGGMGLLLEGKECRRVVSDLKEWCHSFGNIYKDKVLHTEQIKKHLSVGLNKLLSVADSVAELKIQASLKQKEFDEIQNKANQALVEIQSHIVSASVSQEESKKLEALTLQEQEQTNKEKKLIQDELSTVRPILEDAKKRVNGISSAVFAEIRSLAKAPEGIVIVMSAVIKMLGYNENDWSNIRKVLAQQGFLSRIVNLEVKSLSKELRNAVQNMIDSHPNYFLESNIVKVSQAAGPLVAWLIASLKYCQVIEDIAPQEKRLRETEKNLEKIVERAEEYKERVRQIDEKVNKLKEEFALRTVEAEKAKEGLTNTENQIKKAEGLVLLLGDEKNRWQSQLHYHEESSALLPLYTCIASGFTTYIGEYPEEIRCQIVQKWEKLLARENSSPFIYHNFFTSHSIASNITSSTSDSLSLDNSILLSLVDQCPCVIDPSERSLQWMKNTITNEYQDYMKRVSMKQTYQALEKMQQSYPIGTGGEFQIISKNSPSFMSTLERAIRFGHVLTITDFDDTDLRILPLIRKDYVVQSSRMTVSLGEKTFDVDPKFKIILFSKDSQFHVHSYIRRSISLINYSITLLGLEESLLSITLSHQIPSLQKERCELRIEDEKNKRETKALEETLLTTLVESEGFILDNQKLISTLESVKKSSMEMEESVKRSKVIHEKIQEKQSVLRPIAQLGSQLFLLVQKFVSIDLNLRISLSEYIEIFTQSLNEAFASAPNESETQGQAKSDEYYNSRIEPHKERLIALIYKLVSNISLKNNLVSLLLYMLSSLYPDKLSLSDIQSLEKVLLATEKQSQQSDSTASNPAATDTSQEVVSLLKSLTNVRSIALDSPLWLSWLERENCELHFPPNVTSPFHTVLFVAAFRKDRLEVALQNYLSQCLGLSTLSLEASSVTQFIREHSTRGSEKKQRPFLFLLVPGVDPSAEAHALSDEWNIPFRSVSMGGGNENEALEMIQRAAKKGECIFLHNVHLLPQWIPTLEQQLHELESSCQPNFHCFLTSDVQNDFPSSFLEYCIKFSCEPAPGLRSHTLQCFPALQSVSLTSLPSLSSLASTPTILQIQDNSTIVLRAQLNTLCTLLHATLLERREYVPVGYVKHYEFTTSDLLAAVDAVSILFSHAYSKFGQVHPANFDWQTLQGLLHEAIYSSKMESIFDERIIQKYISLLFQSSSLEAPRPISSCQKFKVPPVPIPPTSTLDQHYKSLAANLSDRIDPVSSLDLSSNASNTLQCLRVLDSLKKMKLLQFSPSILPSSTTTTTPQDKLYQDSFLQYIELWNRLAAKSCDKLKRAGEREQSKDDRLNTQEKATRERDSLSSLDIFLSQDYERAVEVLLHTDSVMKNIQAVLRGESIKGNITLLRHDMDVIVRGDTPDSWCRWSFSNDRVVDFFENVVFKFHALAEMTNKKGKRHSTDDILATPINLNHFVCPDAFFAALQLETGHRLNVSVEKLVLENSIKGVEEQGENGTRLEAVIEGLVIEGGHYDICSEEIVANERNALPLTALPKVKFYWIVEEEKVPLMGGVRENVVTLPVYANRNREKVVCHVKYATDHVTDRILNSTAVFIS